MRIIDPDQQNLNIFLECMEKPESGKVFLKYVFLTCPDLYKQWALSVQASVAAPVANKPALCWDGAAMTSAVEEVYYGNDNWSKIALIKQYRYYSGKGLKDAKDEVFAYARYLQSLYGISSEIAASNPNYRGYAIVKDWTNIQDGETIAF